MYEWFSKRQNQIIYAEVLIWGYALAILATKYSITKVNELRSLPENRLVDFATPNLWIIYVHLLIIIGLVFVLLGTFRFITKKPSKVYWYIGLTTIAVQVFLISAVLPMLRLLFSKF